MAAANPVEGASAPSTLQKFDRILEKTTLYNICFRNAGVGLMFWEESRVPAHLLESRVVAEQQVRESPHSSSFLRTLTELSSKITEAGLIVRSYFPSFEEAVDVEWRRLGLDTEKT